MHSFLNGHVDGVLLALIPVSSLTFAEKEGFCDCRHIPDLTISVNQSECSHKPYHSSLSSYPSSSYKIHVTRILCWCRSGQSCAFLIFTLNYPSLPRQFAEQSIKWHIEAWKARNPAVALAFRRGRSTDCKLWSAFLCIRNARYRAYSINMHSSRVINRRGLKRDGAVSDSGQLSMPLSVTGRERQTDKYSSTLRNSTVGYICCF